MNRLALAAALSFIQATNTFGQTITGGGGASTGGATTFNAPSGLVGLLAVAGSSTAADRADSTHALDVSISPTWTGSHTFSNAITLGSVTGATQCLHVNTSGTVSGTGSDCGSGGGGSPSTFPGFVSGNWYLPPYVIVATGNTQQSGRMELVPFQILANVTIKTLGVRVSAIGGTSGTLALGIFSNNALTGRPTGTVLCNTAAITDNAAAGVVTGACVQGTATLSAGVYWAAIETSDSTVGVVGPNSSTDLIASLAGSSATTNMLSSNTGASFYIYGTQTYGTWTLPSSYSEDTTVIRAPLIMWQVN